MFHSAALKLTLYYLTLVMALSVGLSIGLYHVSSHDLNRNAFGQVGYFNNFLSAPDLDNYSNLRAHQLTDDQSHLKDNLILLNLVVLVVGGVASYELARRTLQPIEESHENQRRFAGDASHELRTPLAAMRSEIEVALRDPKLTKQEAVGQLKSNLEEVDKLQNLSDALLKLTSLEGNSIVKKPVNLKNVAQEAIAKHQKQAKARRIGLTSNLSAARVKGDGPSLEQLISVFLDNALKYSPSGSQIHVSMTKSAGRVRLDISDTGPGISPADLPKVFERFYRADNSRSKEGNNGYGLGLSLAKLIAKNHGADIEVKSTPQKGSTFSVSFDIAR